MRKTEHAIVRQHLIDPRTCIRCNACESACPRRAVSHDARNYAVDPLRCNACRSCVPLCPSGAIDSWRDVPRGRLHSVGAQLAWDALPPAG